MTAGMDDMRVPPWSETDRLTTADVADTLGIKPSSWRAYVARGQAPPPDGRHDGRTPWWSRSTIEAWAASRARAGLRLQVVWRYGP